MLTYNLEVLQKDYNNEHQKMGHMKDQMRKLQTQHDHYVQECEDLQIRGSNLNRRIFEIEEKNNELLMQLAFYKSECEANELTKQHLYEEIAK